MSSIRNVLLQLCSEMLSAEGLFALQLSRKDAEKMLVKHVSSRSEPSPRLASSTVLCSDCLQQLLTEENRCGKLCLVHLAEWKTVLRSLI